MEHTAKYFNKLVESSQYCGNAEKIFILKGEQGLGQNDVYCSYIKYIKNVNNPPICFNVRSIPNTLATNSIWNELKKHIELNYEILPNNCGMVANEGLNYEEYLISKLISIGTKKDMYFFCEDIKQCDNELLIFLKKIIDTVFPITQSRMVVCLYTDQNNGMQENAISYIDYFSKFGNITRYINFQLWDDNELLQYLNNYLKGSMTFLSNNTQNALIQVAFGNPTRLASIIEYLKSEGIIYWDFEKLVCLEFDTSQILVKAEKYVLKQYQKLDEETKNLLRCSSIIGQEFDKNLLINPMNFLLYEQQLKKIEHLTKLIHLKIENIYEFQNQATHLSIKNIVSSDEYLTWNVVLANHFLHKGIYNQHINENIEAINDLIKSSFYFSAAEIHDKALQIYLRLVPLMTAIMQYKESILIINIIKSINKKLQNTLKPMQINELQIIEADCEYALFSYSKASVLYEQFLNNSIDTPLKVISVKRKYAMSLYCIGETIRPCQILSDCLYKLEGLKTPNRYLEIVRVLSCMSSIEETLCNGEHINRFNQALALAKEKKIIDEYYQLLRKALIVHKGRNGVRLMDAALEYYRKINNKKEYAMCMHNIATEELYHGDLERAKSYFMQSIEIFKSFGSKGVHYSINALGNYWCIIGNFKKALNYYQDAYSEDCEDFSKIGLYVNQATAHRALKHYVKARKFLKEAEKLLQKKEASTYAIIKQHVTLAIGINEFSAGNSEKAYEFLLSYFKQETDHHSHRKVIAAQCLKLLCDTTNKLFPEGYEYLLAQNSQTIERLRSNMLVLVRFSFAE